MRNEILVYQLYLHPKTGAVLAGEETNITIILEQSTIWSIEMSEKWQ